MSEAYPLQFLKPMMRAYFLLSRLATCSPLTQPAESEEQITAISRLIGGYLISMDDRYRTFLHPLLCSWGVPSTSPPRPLISLQILIDSMHSCMHGQRMIHAMIRSDHTHRDKSLLLPTPFTLLCYSESPRPTKILRTPTPGVPFSNDLQDMYSSMSPKWLPVPRP